MKVLRDTGLVFNRYLLLFLRNPAWVVIQVVQPLLYLILFAPLLKSIAAMPGFPPGGAYNVFVPGLLVQLGLFGATSVGFGLISDLRFGIVERMRVTPLSRLSMLLGRALRDVVTLLVQALIIVLCSLPFGLSLHPLGVVVMLALLALIGLGFASISYALALRLKSEDAYAPLVFTATLPLLLLSGVLLPMSLAPAWLRAVADANPLSYAVDAGRQIFQDHIGDADVIKGLAIMAVLALLAVAAAARSFSRAVA
ncbi:MAG TPA: ABC transporter permease [Candidatus Dormibacteraeota bacterium]|jgi:ABC-2 type transport system permease protein|nr:ABC transporter permease [Candidatus Dormibacteraeota bacterium]